ncbi:MAG: discoidin domain-containing protein, partial [Clostridia bacterium]|nr:discoidin domain-containing protein [Clostridia bacterium]
MKKIISMLLALSMTVGLVFGMTVINSFALEADELDMTDWIAESDSSTSEENWPLSNMFDGELETEWFGKTPVQDGRYHSFTVDMTEIKMFSGVRLYYKQDGNGTYTNGLRQVTLFTKDSEEEDWTAVKTVNYETDADIYEINFGKVVKARYIKYQVEAVNDSGSWWGTVRVQEFRVLAPDYNLAEDEAEITESWSVEAGNLDSWWAGEYPETVATEYVIDGNLGTRWQGFSSGGDMSGQYVVIDMGEATNISGVRAYIPADHIAQAYPLSVTVSVSDNGSDWKEVKSESYTYDESIKELVVDFGKNVEIQYIKYAITSKPAAEGASCIAELRALTAKNSYDDYTYDTLPLFPVADDEIGITSDWSAEGDINEYFTANTSALTIDGSDATLWFAPAAQNGATPSMIVNMGEAKSFSGARVYYNIDGNGAGLTNGLRSVTLLASDNGDDWKALKTVTYTTDETVYEIDLGYNIETQYIKYQINSINDSGSWYGTPMVKEFRALSAKEAYVDETLDSLPLFAVAEDEIAPTASWSISVNATNEWFPDNADANLIMDGNVATQWVGPFVGSNGINDPGAVVNMGEVKSISGVRAYINDFSSYNSYPIKVAVSVS